MSNHPMGRKAHANEVNDYSSSESTQFMLAELGHAREQLGIFVNRFENLLNFYLTGLAAILSAIVILSTALQPSITKNISLLLLGTGAWAFSLVLYTRLLITRALMVQKITQERRNQEYFLARNNHLRKYAYTLLPSTNDWNSWQKIVFTRQTRILFYLLAFFTACLAAVVSIAVMATIFDFIGLPPWSFAGFHLGWYISAGIVAFALTFLICILILKLQLSQAEKYAMWSLDELDKIEIE